ncbi:MAG: PfkB family carbohydrate kinase [Burkholderiales bacterium]
MSKVVTFGEIMVRLNPEGYLRFRQADRFEVSYAGGEANVAVSLANFGMDAKFVTKLPDNDIGQSAIDSIRKYGVDVSNIIIGGRRVGLYYVEKGASQRASKVIYDREFSSIACASRSDFNWNSIFENTKWFHFTGITPALGGELPDICLDACKAAKSRGITVSCDLNYRSKLWSKEKAGQVMSSLMPYVDVCIANESDASDVFGINAAHTNVEAGELDYNAYENVAKQLKEKFDLKACAITLRGSISASENNWAGMLFDGRSAYFSKTYSIKIVDRVGGGDSFSAALIYSLYNGYGAQDAIEFATAASCLKQTIEHDFNILSVQEVQALVSGKGSGRVQR